MTDTPKLLTPYWWHGSTVLLAATVTPMCLAGSIHHILHPGKLDRELAQVLEEGNTLEDTVNIIAYLGNISNW